MTQERFSKLSSWMDERHMTLAELARRMELDYSHVWRMARGERPVTNSFIGLFAKTFGFGIAEEVFGDSQQQPCQEQAS